MDDEEAAYALHHGPGAHAAPGDSEDEDGVGVYDVDEEDEDEGEHTEDDEEDPIEVCSNGGTPKCCTRHCASPAQLLAEPCWT